MTPLGDPLSLAGPASGSIRDGATTGCMLEKVDDPGQPISYKTLAAGTPVYSSDGEKVGVVAHVLSAPEEDVFDGIVLDERKGPGGHRFADADDVETIHERAVTLKLDAVACRSLHAPSENPAVMKDDPAEGAHKVTDKLRRAWDLVSGNY
jgi:hypothetical protein